MGSRVRGLSLSAGWIGVDAPTRQHGLPWQGYAWAIAAVAIATTLNFLAGGRATEPTRIMIFLLALLPVAMRGNRGASLLAAVMAVAAFNFFFTEPRYTLLVYDLGYLVTFAAMGLTGVLVSSLTARLASELAATRRAESELAMRAGELARANQALLEADRYKDEFLAALSHELRTPLSGIIGFGTMLSEGDAGPLNEEQQTFVRHLLLDAERLNALIRDLMELSRIQAGKFELAPAPTPFEPVVHDAIVDLAPRATEKGIQLRVDVEVPGEIVMDGERIMEVIHQLVENAVKFTPRGGRITVRAYPQGDRVLTEVLDTGVGIAPGDLPKLFRRFQQLDMSATRTAGGLGMGLAISKAIVQAHGGQIGVMSEQGKGSRFWFSLPRVPALAEHGPRV